MTRVVIWVQHLLGTGHTVRAAALAHALTARGAHVTMVLGARPPDTLDLSGIATVALPPVAATDATFRHIVGETGEPYAALAARRTALWRETVARAEPDILMTETFPLGRRAFAKEVLSVLVDPPTARRPIVAASVRDVLVRKARAAEVEMAERVRRWYDVVLVHADPAFVRLEDSFGEVPAIADRLRYTGFVHAAAPATGDAAGPSGEIVVSSGGGAVGARLAEAALGAARLMGRGQRWRILVAPGLREAAERWRGTAPAFVTVEPNRPDFRALLSHARLSVSQAGYNTVLDVLAAGTRALLVPFAAHGETEQSARAAALARRGLATLVSEGELSAERLAAAVGETLKAPPPARLALDLDGAGRSADILLAAARR